MKKLNVKSKLLNVHQGFSLVEALLTLAIFALMVTAFVGSIFYGQESVVISGVSSQAGMLAEEGLEAVRNIRDGGFSNLSNGIHGLSFSEGEWSLSGTSDTTDLFVRQVEISEIDPNTKLAKVSVSSSYGVGRNVLISTSTEFSKWREYNPTQAEQILINVSGVEVSGTGNVDLSGMTIENIGIEDVVIENTEISWSGIPSVRRLENINIDGSSYWSGSDSSGSSQNINFTLELGQTYPTYLTFNGSIIGIKITIIFTMGDGSTVLASFDSGTGADTTPPGKITDLSVSNPSTSSVDLSWTSPGDDGSVGTASVYDIRYSTSVINDSNWESATQVSAEPTPLISGSIQSMTVSGLNIGTIYYFAIKTSDEVSNESEISNLASGATSSMAQANYLVVNTAGTILSANSRDVLGITLQNSGPADITISSLTVSWTGINSNRRLRNIAIDGVQVWSGNVTSGTLNNITDVIISSGVNIPINYLRFSNTISGEVLDLVFHMSDGSSKSVSGIGPL